MPFWILYTFLDLLIIGVLIGAMFYFALRTDTKREKQEGDNDKWLL